MLGDSPPCRWAKKQWCTLQLQDIFPFTFKGQESSPSIYCSSQYVQHVALLTKLMPCSSTQYFTRSFRLVAPAARGLN